MSNIDFIPSQSRPHATCEHCMGTVEHEPWCVIRDPKVPALAWGDLAQPSTIAFHATHMTDVCVERKR
jgi:hypothetical protein